MIDILRARYPDWGFALYALEPRGPVTFEVHTPDGLFTGSGGTAEEAILSLYPDMKQETPDEHEAEARHEEAGIFG